MDEDPQPHPTLQAHLKTVAIALSVVATIAIPFVWIGQAYVAQAIAQHEDVIDAKFVSRAELSQQLTFIQEKLAENGKKIDDLTAFVQYIRETQIQIKTRVDNLPSR